MTTTTSPKRSNSTRIFLIIISVFMCIICLCCFLVIGATGGLAAVTAIFLSNSASKTETEAIRLEPSDTRRLIIDDSGLSVTIVAGENDSQITLESEITAYTYAESIAERSLNDISVNLQRDAATGVRVALEDNASGVVFSDADVTLTIPPEMDEIVIKTASDVEIRGVTANFDIDLTGSADVTLINVDGNFNVATKSSFGDISFRGRMNPNSSNRFETRSGDILIEFTESPNLVYSAQTGRSNTSNSSTSSNIGHVDCPQGATVAQYSCSGRLGDATGILDVVSRNGDITIRVP